jgi:N-hydroxyarylamine O-acetyltransferase
MDLDAYFARIGYTGPRIATLAVLRDLHARHALTIPFENLDPLLQRPVSLSLEGLEAKLVHGRRGGYCFEQNTLFRAVLQQLGFAVTSLAARVLWMRPQDAPVSPRTHMLLLVDLDGAALVADVGFGGHLLGAPLTLAADVEQPTGWGVLRFVRADPGFVLQTRLGDAWADVYRFTLEPQMPMDYEVANWFTSAHPNSLFRHNLMVQRLTAEGRVSLLNRRLTRRGPDGRATETALANASELSRVLAEEFGLDPPADVADVFARLPAA